MRRKHLVLLASVLFCACLCFLVLQKSTPEAQDPRMEPMRGVVAEAPVIDVPIRALQETAHVNNVATEHFDLEKTDVVSAPPPVVSLDTPTTAKSHRAFMTGMVAILGDWELRSFQLEFYLIGGDPAHPRVIESGEMQGFPGRADAFLWSLPVASAGRYQVVVQPTLFSVEFDVGPEGRRDIMIDVPPPSSVEVNVVDALTRTPSRVAWLDLQVLMKQSDIEPVAMTEDPFEQLMHQAWTGRAEENDTRTGLFRFVKVPQGSFVCLRTRSTVSTGASTAETGTFRRLEPGRNKFRLFTNDVGGFVLCAKDGDDFID